MASCPQRRHLAVTALLKRAVWLGIFLFFGGGATASVFVDTDWLAAHLGDPAVVIVDMSADDLQYQRFHIPGAVRLPYQALVRQRPDGVVLRIGDDELYRILGRLGIGAATQVVVYDDVGGLSAGRLFWELERVGHPAVSVLDGGLVKWILEGRTVHGGPSYARSRDYGVQKDSGRANEAVLDQVKAAVVSGETVLVDVRTEEEYRGSRKEARSGHLPCAEWWPWDQAVRYDRGFVLQDAGVLERRLAENGIQRKDDPVILYCRTGHRASQTYLVLRHLGFTDVRLYDGSMAEYSRNEALPLVRGAGACPDS
jgi:thiosulfate/3-mercaptopyruvate sulfurtransferase